MNEKKKLLFEQIIEINKKIEDLKNERKQLIEVMKDSTLCCYISPERTFSDIPEYNTSNYKAQIDQKIKDLEELLSKAVEVVDYNEEFIDIGTRFSAVVDYGDEIEANECILVDSRESCNKKSNITYITPDSPFGAAVIGKKIGDGFYYKINNEVIVGFIEDITPKEEIEKGKQKIK